MKPSLLHTHCMVLTTPKTGIPGQRCGGKVWYGTCRQPRPACTLPPAGLVLAHILIDYFLNIKLNPPSRRSVLRATCTGSCGGRQWCCSCCGRGWCPSGCGCDSCWLFWFLHFCRKRKEKEKKEQPSSKYDFFSFFLPHFRLYEVVCFTCVISHTNTVQYWKCCPKERKGKNSRAQNT